MLHFDLHCHSTRSDGLLTPAELVARAAERGVRALALTDHDEIGGLHEACTRAAQVGITFITGRRTARITRRLHSDMESVLSVKC